MLESVNSPQPAPARPPADAVSLVIARARQLVVDGRAAEAIAYATEQNRTLADPQIEYQLVIWRNLAYRASNTSAPEWPPEIRDPFPKSATPPEIGFDELSLQTLGAGILHHGCVIVRGLIPTALANQLSDDIRKTFDACRRTKAGAPAEQGRPWFAPFKPHDPQLRVQRAGVQRANAAIWTADSPRVLFELVEAFAARRIFDIVQAFLGERPVLSVQKGTLRLVPPTTGADWHQDGAFLGGQTRAVNVWVTMSDCGVDAPGLDLMPRRVPYVVETGTSGAKFRWSVGAPVVMKEAGEVPVATPVYRAGDAVIFDPLFLHRTGVRPGMTRDRTAIETWLFAPSTKPDWHQALVV